MNLALNKAESEPSENKHKHLKREKQVFTLNQLGQKIVNSSHMKSTHMCIYV